MAIGVFTDKEHPPTVEEIFAAVGSRRPLWERLIRFIMDSYRSQGELNFGGKNYGWALRFRKGGKALLSIYPGAGSFTVQIVLGPTLTEKAFGLNLGPNARKTLENARQFPEGRWLYIKMDSERDLDDVLQLLAVKAPPHGSTGRGPRK